FNILSTVLIQGINFFTLPIFTRVLGAEQYGIYSVFSSWVMLLVCVMGLGVQSSIGTGKYHFKKEYYSFRSSVLLFGTLFNIILILLVTILIKPVSAFLGYSFLAVEMLLWTAFANFIINFAQNAYIYEKKAGVNFFVSVFLTISTFALSLYLLSVFSGDDLFLSRVFGVGIPYFLLAVIIWFVLFFRKPCSLHKEYCVYSITMGIPIIFHLLSQNILSQSDRVMMQKMHISNLEIGIYSFFYSFVSVLSTILTALNNSWCPFYYDDLDSENWKRLNKKSENYIELFTVLTIGFLLLSREVGYLLSGEEYSSGMNILPILVFAVYFTFMYQFPVNFEFFHRKTNIIAIGTSSSAILNIILNCIMIPIWGMYGAALATTVSYFLLFLAHYFIVTHMKDV
ncbi:oligosaccharide flippase family protein, partial [Mordavella massiliensis]|nr:oligosaccharide flippase family protein [Mordavella massiliensis]